MSKPRITGHHQVRLFYFKTDDLRDGVDLPKECKPFGFFVAGLGIVILCRKWIRDEPS